MLTVAIESPLQPAIAALIRQSDAVAARLYPDELRRPITPESLAAPAVTLLAARLNGEAVGCCALLARDDGSFELKRMIVDEQAQRQGVGTSLVRKAQEIAQSFGASAILLEVGIHNIEAEALYRRAGFVMRGPFQPHQATAVSRFMELRLASA